MSDRRESPVALVTGASRGIGAATARLLARRGYRLALMSRSACEDLTAELGAWHSAGSLTDEDDVKDFVDGAVARFGRLDAVVASTGRYASILEKLSIVPTPLPRSGGLGFDPDFKPDLFAIPREAWHDALDLLVLSTVNIAKFATPHLLASGEGAIVAISGMEAAEPRLRYLLSPVRSAIHGFARLYSDRYAASGIRMNCVVPGMLENAVPDSDSELLRSIPMGRTGRLEEIAETIAFLASPASSYITGQLLLADGGLNRGLG
jgi:NAD(P)-dependent dehydrogenase (short-subunit alcohol dehydrogenase family)